MSPSDRSQKRRRSSRPLLPVVVILLLAAAWPQMTGWFGDSGQSTTVSVAPNSASDADRPTADVLSDTAGPGAPATSPHEQQSPQKDKSSPAEPARPRSMATSRTASRESGDEEPASATLTQIEPNVYRSPAGLIYRPGSRDGHRLKHILKHATDNPDKPVHGVFQGDRDSILRWIDSAYSQAERGSDNARQRQQNQRIAITARMQEQIGYVGGQRGARDNYPACFFLRLILEDDGRTVVTAYPVSSF